MQLAGDFGASAVVGRRINANDAGNERTRPSTADRGPVAPGCPALMLGKEFEIVVFKGSERSGPFFDPGGNETVGEGE